ncbi:MAG: hypothetical protein WDN28_28700 [Chthoniobacter sp.]
MSRWRRGSSRSAVRGLSYKGTQLAQGRDAAKELLKTDNALYTELEAAVMAKLDEEK